MTEWKLEPVVEPLLLWYEKNARVLPWRENQDPYRIWVSEIMLQQTRVDAVIAYYERFMKRLPTIRDLAAVEEEELMKLWEGLGYYSRARNLRKAAQFICEQYDGKFPEEMEQILELPGIGTYTAGAIASIAFAKPVAAVDGNVLRVITRLTACSQDIMDAKFRQTVTKELEKIYPPDHCGDFTQSLMELGAMVCVPNGAPLCEKCPLKELCKAFETQTQLKYPVKKKKAERKVQDLTVLLLRYQDKIAICKREDKGLLGGMWEFPNIEGNMDTRKVWEWVSEKKLEPSSLVPLPAQKHIFSHVEWHMCCYEVWCSKVKEDGGLVWADREQFEKEIALPTAFRKILKKLS